MCCVTSSFYMCSVRVSKPCLAVCGVKGVVISWGWKLCTHVCVHTRTQGTGAGGDARC